MAVTGSLTATGATNSFRPNGKSPAFNFTVSGTFVGTVRPERSFDDGDTWHPLTALGSAISFTAPCSEVFEEPENYVLYRANCTAYTSGTIAVRMSQ